MELAAERLAPMALDGSNVGDANNHCTWNMSILLASGFRHGRHVAFDQRDNDPLPNLFVRMRQKLGLEVDQFASRSGTLTEVG